MRRAIRRGRGIVARDPPSGKRTGAAQRGREAEEQAGSQRGAQGEEQHAAIDGGLLQAGQRGGCERNENAQQDPGERASGYGAESRSAAGFR